MSLYSYEMSRQLVTYDFDDLLMALIVKADSNNTILLKAAFPNLWAETEARYHAPGGILPTDKIKGLSNAC